MEARLNYHFKCGCKKKQLKFTGISGSEWTLTKEYVSDSQHGNHTIKIQKASRGIHRFYYADVELCTPYGRNLLLKQSVKGSWAKIEVILSGAEIFEGLISVSQNPPELLPSTCVGHFFLCKIELFPVLELRSEDKFRTERLCERQTMESFVCDISALITDPALNFSHDVMVVSDTTDTTSITAHKNILFTGFTEFRDQLQRNMSKERRMLNGLEIVELDSVAAADLRERVLSAYTDGDSKILLTVDFCILAKEMREEVQTCSE